MVVDVGGERKMGGDGYEGEKTWSAWCSRRRKKV